MNGINVMYKTVTMREWVGYLYSNSAFFLDALAIEMARKIQYLIKPQP